MSGLRSNSLALRLILSAAAVAIVLLVAAAILLDFLFRSAVERNFDARLVAVLDGLTANVELAQDGSPGMQNQIADARFSIPSSGWYWQVSPPPEKQAAILVSESLLEQPLVPEAELMKLRDKDGVASFYLTDPAGQQLRAIEKRLKLFGGADEYSFLIAGNFDELKSEISAFQRALYLVLGLLGAGLLLAIFVQVKFGLRPMARMQESLTAIREGKAERLEGKFPTEMQPVAEELNLLIQANTEIIERARTQVGNLAHALKTPLSVLTNEARDTKGPLAAKVTEQTQVMRDQVSLYLDRARRAARAQTIGSVTEIEPVLAALGRTLMRINQDKGTVVEVAVPPGLKFRGEKQDLEEMAGNLMDNACKWSASKVTVKAAPTEPIDGRMWLEIMVDDDVPGLPEDKRADAMKRGRRLDESKPGSGLGLSIVAETAAMYGGSLRLDHAKGGGLRSVLKLPAVQ
jgi:signal transduction histidine kinase